MLRNTLLKYFYTKYLGLQKKKKANKILTSTLKYRLIKASSITHKKKIKSKMRLRFFKHVHKLWVFDKILKF